jgi:hypothetical protein
VGLTSLAAPHRRPLKSGGTSGISQRTEDCAFRSAQAAKYAVLLDEPRPFDAELKIVDLLNSRMKNETTDAERKTLRNDSPALKVQSFQLADGSLRYDARAKWASVKDSTDISHCILVAWLTPLLALRI